MPDCANLVFVAGEWLHDLIVVTDELRISSGRVAGAAQTRILVTDAWNGSLSGTVRTEAEAGWHWEASDAEARAALTLLTSHLRRLTGAH